MAKAITANGHAQVDTAQKVFGTGSGLFDGNGDDYLSTPDHADFDLAAGDFTLECRFRAAAFTAQNYQMAHVKITGYPDAGQDRAWGLATPAGTSIQFYYTTDGSTDKVIKPAYTFSINTWYHLAVTRTGGKIYFFVDGTLVNAGGTALTDTIWNCSYYLAIGRLGTYTAADHSMNGWIDEIRITKGLARWTANFTPPNVAYRCDVNTHLLIHCDGADASTVFTDDDIISGATSTLLTMGVG